MRNFISLNIVREGDGSGRLLLEFSSGGFSGFGSAYFDLTTLAHKAEEFAEYPLPVGRPVLLAGGFWEKGDFSKLRQEHLHISAYPLGVLGHIGMMLKVAEPAEDGRGAVLTHSASAEFLMDYEVLSRFSRGLVGLAAGEIEQFVLEMPN